MNMKRVVIVGAKRTPIGRFRGALADRSPVELGLIAGEAAIAAIDRKLIDQVIIGNVFAAGHGMNMARQIAVRLGLPLETPATTINQMCGSGMQAALMAVTAIRAGEADVVLVGGAESMSQAGLIVNRPSKREAPDLSTAVDTLQRDGLLDSFSDRHMGEQAERLADSFNISREHQDAFALRSQQLYERARVAGMLDDELARTEGLSDDQHPRPETSFADLADLRTAFLDRGTVTAGNSSGVNDGAAMLVLAEWEVALRGGWPILAEWVDGVVVGCDPDRMGLGPVHAIRRLFIRTGHGWADIDRLEINEAFAAQVLACLQSLELSLETGTESATDVTTSDGHAIRFNAEGGAIAIGHPLAVSGARLLVHLAWQLHCQRSKAAVASLCVGGGMGIAAMLRQPG
jgi:acetyl-CoA C-acetyltransferase